ncbi:translation initiation factor IF-2, partial [Lactobacillus nasalidis]
MTKKQENETSKELGMDNKKASGKSGKLKISVTAIRKGEKKTEGKRPSARRRNNHSNDHSKRRRPAAQDLLKDLKQKQRADEVRLDQASRAAKKEYKKSLNKAAAGESKPEVKKVESSAKETVTEAPKLRGPKILKPSPARLKQNQSSQEKPASRNSAPRRTSSRPNFAEAPMPENKDNRRRNNGKPGRKGQNAYQDQGRNANSDRTERRKRKNKKHQNAPVKKQVTQRKERPLPESFEYEVGMNAQDLGKILHREPAEIVKKLFMLGIMTNQNQSLDKDTIELLAADYGIEAVEKVHEDISDIDNIFAQEMEESKKSENQVVRPPVVTIMGHVDHGKTTLLDRLRHTRVSEHEAGGITQNIGAYQVRINDRLITFLDTPGHAAFSSMRARGAEITDIVVLIVAADDGVMPQTIEAIDHAKSAGVPIIVAINKMDRPGANPAHVTEQLMQYELIPEAYGGSTIFVNISAKTGMGIDELLENIILEADMLELKADPKQKAIGTVVEARLSRGKGPVADVLIQQGTLRIGDPIVVGDTFGRVRTMTNDKGHQVKKATPAMPVEITGLNDVPESADKLVVFDDEKTARSVGEARAQQSLQKQRENVQHVTLDNLFDTMKRESMKSVDIVLKADVQGSAEALAQSFQKIDVEGVRVNIIHSGVGAINESDVTLASASNALIIGFNVRPTATAKSQAAQEGVDIRLYSVIYKAIDDVKAAMQGML